jgi:uncharacterized repeat protein (TIGR01451 family)
MTRNNKSDISGEVMVLMIKRMVLLVVILGLIFSLPSSVLAAGMDMKSIVEKEVKKVGVDGKEHLEYVSADTAEVVPGDVMRFTNIYRNTGKETAEPGLAINNPVPKDIAYIGGSATGAGARITYSVDGGKSFGNPSELFVAGGDGKKRLARPDEYTDIKWMILKAVLPGEEGSVAYKGRLK